MKAIEKLFEYIQEKRKIFWFITLFFVSLNGCFMYPLSDYLKDFTGYSIYTLYIIYIGLLFLGLLRNNTLAVYLLTLLFTAAGIGIRYFIEIGEVSNAINFTIKNLFTFIFIYPASIALYYYLYLKIYPDKNKVRNTNKTK